MKQVLITAVRGAEIRVSYIKNPRRELDRMISKDYLEFSEICACLAEKGSVLILLGSTLAIRVPYL